MASRDTAVRLYDFLSSTLSEFPSEIVVNDWTDRTYSVGGNQPHWRELPLSIDLKSPAAGKDLLALRPMSFLQRFLTGEVDLRGNLYLLSDIRHHAKMSVSWWRLIPQMLASRAFLFQNMERAKVNVRSHYDIPQEALDVYLDQTYRSYSCGMFEHPDVFELDELVATGDGQDDAFDSLEKSQWRKFDDAVGFVDPKQGESLLDVGCGYGGQLQVALDAQPFGQVVGWTHSHNQVVEGKRQLASSPNDRWELHEGDFREEGRVFDHITSTGMVSHVGPRGLVPYVREIRKRIKKGGRYVHHALMDPYSPQAFDSEVGIAFNKRYVWPGFHWFTMGTHVKALEENGFEVTKLVNLSRHYAKTTAAWYERMMAQEEIMLAHLGEHTFRAWRIYLAGASAGFQNGSMHVYRLYCRSV